MQKSSVSSEQRNNRGYLILAGVILCLVVIAALVFQDKQSDGIKAGGDVSIGDGNVINSGSGDIIQNGGQ